MSGLYQASGSAVSPAVYVVPCVRFNCVVRLYIFTSFTVATLGMSAWLDLAQQGLPPCKKRQASLGALTLAFNGAHGELGRHVSTGRGRSGQPLQRVG